MITRRRGHHYQDDEDDDDGNYDDDGDDDDNEGDDIELMKPCLPPPWVPWGLELNWTPSVIRPSINLPTKQTSQPWAV